MKHDLIIVDIDLVEDQNKDCWAIKGNGLCYSPSKISRTFAARDFGEKGF